MSAIYKGVNNEGAPHYETHSISHVSLKKDIYSTISCIHVKRQKRLNSMCDEQNTKTLSEGFATML